MTLDKIITVTGLSLDIVGAVLLSKGVFFETTKELIDKGGIKQDRYNTSNRIKNYYSNVAVRIVDRCKEIFQTRIGLFLLVIGFILQLSSQFLPNRPVESMLEIILIIIIPLLLTGSSWLLAINYDEKLKQDALVELIDRILPNSVHTDSLNLPSGMPYSTIENVCKIFLKRKLSFSGFKQNIKDSQRTPDVWLTLERARRFSQKHQKT